MRIIIMAGGTAKTFNRHSITVQGEKLVDRTVRLLKENGQSDIWVTVAQKGMYPQYNEFVNNMKGNDLGCLLGCEELKGNVWLYGDVYYSENAIKTILNGTTNYYGRAKGNALKKYGEFWAFKSDDTFWHWLKLVCKAFWDKKINRCWSWDLYAYHSGKWNLNSPPQRKTVKRTQYICNTNWTNIDDETDDFDKADEVQRWKIYWKKND